MRRAKAVAAACLLAVAIPCWGQTAIRGWNFYPVTNDLGRFTPIYENSCLSGFKFVQDGGKDYLFSGKDRTYYGPSKLRECTASDIKHFVPGRPLAHEEQQDDSTADGPMLLANLAPAPTWLKPGPMIPAPGVQFIEAAPTQKPAPTVEHFVIYGRAGAMLEDCEEDAAGLPVSCHAEPEATDTQIIAAMYLELASIQALSTQQECDWDRSVVALERIKTGRTGNTGDLIQGWMTSDCEWADAQQDRFQKMQADYEARYGALTHVP